PIEGKNFDAGEEEVGVGVGEGAGGAGVGDGFAEEVRLLAAELHRRLLYDGRLLRLARTLPTAPRTPGSRETSFAMSRCPLSPISHGSHLRRRRHPDARATCTPTASQ